TDAESGRVEVVINFGAAAVVLPEGFGPDAVCIGDPALPLPAGGTIPASSAWMSSRVDAPAR
ncbi:MAG: hypothetical protein ACT4PL_00260, partial [Phycisphaerales bacterium]